MELKTLPDGRRIAPRIPGDPEGFDAVELASSGGACDGCAFEGRQDDCPGRRAVRGLTCLKHRRGPGADFYVTYVKAPELFGNEEE